MATLTAQLAGALLALVSGAVEVDLAPDQPLGFVYADDPLIIELSTDTPTTASVQLSVEAGHGGATGTAALEGVRLRPHSARWWAIESLPQACGYYTAQISITSEMGLQEATAKFARIHRPGEGPPLPVVVTLESATPQALLALRSVGISRVRLDTAAPTFSASARAAVDWNFQLVPLLDLAALDDPSARAAVLGAEFPTNVARWEILAHSNPTALRATVQALRRGGTTAPVAITVDAPDVLRQLAANGAGDAVREAVLPGTAQPPAFRRAAEGLGYEAWVLHAGDSASGVSGPQLVQRILGNLAVGFQDTTLPFTALFDGAPTEGLVYLSGLHHRLGAYRDAAPLPLPAGAAGVLFRDRNAWLLAVWNAEATVEVPVEVGSAQQLTLTDALNNPREVPAVADGRVTLSVGPSPVYLSGLGGALPGAAAAATVRREAPAFVDAYRGILADEIVDLVASFARNDSNESERVRYFELLRDFPALEQALQQEAVPTEVAIPALAQMARIARALATLQQEAGEKFLEPIENALARSEEAQSLYLTGSVASSEARKRGDWLLQETHRLMDEAEALDASGREIEAVAVATLAEYRARALEYAASAPPTAPVLAEVVAKAAERAEAEQQARVAAEALAEVQAAPPVILETPGVTVPPVAEVATVAPVAMPPAEEKTAAVLDEGEIAPEPDAVSETTEDAPIRADRNGPAPEGTVRVVHTVARNEFPGTIARNYKVRLDDMLAWNGLTRDSTLRIGQEIILFVPADSDTARKAEAETERVEADSPADAAKPAAGASGKAEVYVVKRGDVPASIAKRYGVEWQKLYEWNGWKKNHILQIGDEVKVFRQ